MKGKMVTPTRSRRRHERASRSSDQISPATEETPTPKRSAPADAAEPFWAFARGNAGAAIPGISVADVKEALETTDKRVWIDLISPDHDLLAQLTDVLGLHPLVVEDILESN